MAAILVSQNSEIVDVLVNQTNPVTRVQLFCYVNIHLC